MAKKLKIKSFQDIGAGKGKYYAVNFPLRDGIDDDNFEAIFVPVMLFCIRKCLLNILRSHLKVMSKVMESFQPNAVVLQCGADSLTGDRLGCFNLTIKG